MRRKVGQDAIQMQKFPPRRGRKVSLVSLSPYRHEENGKMPVALAFMAMLLLAASSFPHLLGWQAADAERIYSGTLSNNMDQLSYYAKMRQGSEGAWLYTNRYTTEESRPVPLFIFYLFLGHVARWTGLSIIATYHLARIFCAGLLMFSADRFIRSLEWRGAMRIGAFLFIFTAGGFGWLQSGAAASSIIEQRPIEFWLIEAFAFQSMANYPHFALATALMFIVFADVVEMGHENKRLLIGSIIRVLFASFLLAWIHPRLLLTLASVIGGAGVASHLLHIGNPQKWFIGSALVVAGGAIPSAWILYSLVGDPTWRECAEPEMLSLPPMQYAMGFGLLIPLAVLGLWRGIKRREAWVPFLGAWLLVGALLPYLPMASQRRLIQGYNVPLAMLAAVVVVELKSWGVFKWRGTIRLPLLAIAVGIILSLSTFAYLEREIRRIGRGSYPTFISREQLNLMNWLHEHTTRDSVVMSSIPHGALIPPMAGNRVVMGHWAETFKPREKEKEIKAFFNTATTSEQRDEIVNRHRIRFVIHGEFERKIGGYDPGADATRWDRIWGTAALQLYQRREGANPS